MRNAWRAGEDLGPASGSWDVLTEGYLRFSFKNRALRRSQTQGLVCINICNLVKFTGVFSCWNYAYNFKLIKLLDGVRYIYLYRQSRTPEARYEAGFTCQLGWATVLTVKHSPRCRYEGVLQTCLSIYKQLTWSKGDWLPWFCGWASLRRRREQNWGFPEEEDSAPRSEPACLACPPALRISDLPVPIIAYGNSLKLISFSLFFSLNVHVVPFLWRTLTYHALPFMEVTVCEFKNISHTLLCGMSVCLKKWREGLTLNIHREAPMWENRVGNRRWSGKIQFKKIQYYIKRKAVFGLIMSWTDSLVHLILCPHLRVFIFLWITLYIIMCLVKWNLKPKTEISAYMIFSKM